MLRILRSTDGINKVTSQTALHAFFLTEVSEKPANGHVQPRFTQPRSFADSSLLGRLFQCSWIRSKFILNGCNPKQPLGSHENLLEHNS